MMDSYMTNNHLKDVLKEVKSNVESEQEIPVELIMQFSNELKVSNLLVPAVQEDDETFVLEQLLSDDEELVFIPLFTDIEEYEKYDADEGFSPMAFDFELYADIVLENGFEGIVINVESDEIPVNSEMIEAMYSFPQVTADVSVEPYGPDELKNVFDTVKNESLLEFIRGDNNRDIEKLYVELSGSVLLNMVASEVSLDEFAQDGIISSDDVGGFGLCSIDDDGLTACTLFTDRDAMNEAADPDGEVSLYGQITVLSSLFDFMLRSDMDAVIINPNSDDYVILREDILPQASGIEIVLDNPKFRNCPEYAFLL